MCADRCVEDGGDADVQIRYLSVGYARDSSRPQGLQQGVFVIAAGKKLS